jgi:hypothetical protein
MSMGHRRARIQRELEVGLADVGGLLQGDGVGHLVVGLVVGVLARRLPVHDELAPRARRADEAGDVEADELDHPVLEPRVRVCSCAVNTFIIIIIISLHS